MRTSVLIGSLACAAFVACTGYISTPPGRENDKNDNGKAALSAWLPARVRRLSNRELDNSVKDLLSTTTVFSKSLPKDVRQSGFTLNAEQRVDATYAGGLQSAADAVAEEAVTARLDTLVSCTDSRDCAVTFVDEFAARAFRRPLIEDERAGLLAIYDVAAVGTFADGIRAIISAVLQSASFLYVTELGRDGKGTLTELGPYETASALSYLVTAAPPDPSLLDAAAHDDLRTPDQREAHARQLVATSPHFAQQIARLIKEWLGLDQLAEIDRTSTVEDAFASLSPLFDQETDAFVNDVVTNGDGTLATLLSADFSVLNAKLASFYGVPFAGTTDWARTPLGSTPRRGLLSQANFLSTYASNSPPGSSPVKRGKVVLNQLICLNIHFPTDPNVAMKASVLPPPDPNATTRQRFEQHSTDPVCSVCHKKLDGIGFAFENFDQIGKFRSTENGQPIDASGELLGSDVDGPYEGVGGLVERLAASEDVRRCFATNFFRFASGQTTEDTEAAYLDQWESLPSDARTQITELIVGYVRSDIFVKRSVQ